MSQKLEAKISFLMQPSQANIGGAIHGGEVMKLMDHTAGVVALRYSKGRVVTARVDDVQFLCPVVIGAYITFTGRLVYVGSSSMEITVTAYVEDLLGDNPPKKALSAHVTMVALDKEGRPRKIEPLLVESDEMRKLWEDAKKRREGRNRDIHME
jgi:acyl-CoA hydrolase